MTKTVKVSHTLQVQVNFTGNESKKSMAFINYFLIPGTRGLLWDIFNCTLKSTDELVITEQM